MAFSHLQYCNVGHAQLGASNCFHQGNASSLFPIFCSRLREGVCRRNFSQSGQDAIRLVSLPNCCCLLADYTTHRCLLMLKSTLPKVLLFFSPSHSLPPPFADKCQRLEMPPNTTHQKKAHKKQKSWNVGWATRKEKKWHSKENGIRIKVE